MNLEVDLLDIRINKMKVELILIARETGLGSPDKLRCSQKLDQLIIFKMQNSKEKVKC